MMQRSWHLLFAQLVEGKCSHRDEMAPQNCCRNALLLPTTAHSSTAGPEELSNVMWTEGPQTWGFYRTVDFFKIL